MPAGLADRDLIKVIISYLYELRLTGLPAAALSPELPSAWDRWLVCFRLWLPASRIEGLPNGAGAGCEVCRTRAAALSRSQPPTHPDALALTCRCFDQWAARMRDRRPSASPLDFPGMLTLALLKPESPAAGIRAMLGEHYRVLAERRLMLSLAGMRRLYPDAYGEEFVARQREYLTRGPVEALLLTSVDGSPRRARDVRDDVRRRLGVKVGITAEHRGANRLREQGALSYCLVARGPFMAVRRSETLISGARVASERIASRTKQDAWWLVPNRDRRTARLAELHTMAAGVAGGVAGITTLPFEPVDQVPLYGFDREVPSRYERVVAASAGAVISGRLTHLIGKLAFLEAPTSTLLLDLRLLEGWSLRRTDLPSGGLELETRSREAHARATQQTLF